MKNKTTSSSRRVPVLGALACALTLAALPAARADAPTDGALAADHAGYRAQQAAIQRLNDTGAHPLRSFSLAKAQCWLDASFHEYTRNDRSRFPQDRTFNIGQRLQLRHKDGRVRRGYVTAVTDETVQIDLNHPLAGKVLTFHLNVLKIGAV